MEKDKWILKNIEIVRQTQSPTHVISASFLRTVGLWFLSVWLPWTCRLQYCRNRRCLALPGGACMPFRVNSHLKYRFLSGLCLSSCLSLILSVCLCSVFGIKCIQQCTHHSCFVWVFTKQAQELQLFPAPTTYPPTHTTPSPFQDKCSLDFYSLGLAGLGFDLYVSANL